MSDLRTPITRDEFLKMLGALIHGVEDTNSTYPITAYPDQPDGRVIGVLIEWGAEQWLWDGEKFTQVPIAARIR